MADVYSRVFKHGKLFMENSSFESSDSPVKAIARRTRHILANGGTEDSLLCDYFLASQMDVSNTKTPHHNDQCSSYNPTLK